MVFLLPLLPWVIGTVLSAAAVLFVNDRLRDKTSGKTLANIGDSKTGKTTLARFLSQGIMGDHQYEATMVTEEMSGRTITLDNQTVLHVGDLEDLPGEMTAWLEWKLRVQKSQHVLYMIRSPHLRQKRGTALDRCRRDLQQLKLWLEDMEADVRPTVLLVFNFRDQDGKAWDAEPSHPAYGAGLVGESGLDPQVAALRRLTKVHYVSGSMITEDATKDLLAAIGEAL